jgi:hypothetical protein
MTHTNKKAVILLVALIGVVVAGRLIFREGPSNDSVRIGNRGVLFGHGGALVAVGKDESALTEFHNALRIKDSHGTEAILLSGRVFSVRAGTQILVIDYGSVGVRKIRILDGDREGLAGFVYEESVRRTSFD